MSPNIVVVFDLDDTLYYEIDYLKSAYKEIALLLCANQNIELSKETIFNQMINFYYKGENVFSKILVASGTKDYSVLDLIEIYRNHQPNIYLNAEVESLLNFLKKSNVQMGLITDGRSIQQRAKIKALGLNKYLSNIVISEEFGSEKPNLKNYQIFEEKYTEKKFKFLYVGDNLKKDFVTPNKLGWYTICLMDKDGLNVHSQNVLVANKFLPKIEINSIIELKDIIINLDN